MSLPTPEEIAVEFSLILRSWLSADDIEEAIERNRTEQSELVCHSHDHCDANMAMEEAMNNFGISVLSDDEESDQPLNEDVRLLWNAAWEIAKDTEFAVAGELEPMVANDALGG